jgi:hypothetical protein
VRTAFCALLGGSLSDRDGHSVEMELVALIGNLHVDVLSIE